LKDYQEKVQKTRGENTKTENDAEGEKKVDENEKGNFFVC